MTFTFDVMKTLAEHMEKTGTTDAALAATVKCDRSMITKIRNRQATPSLPLALAISKATGVDVAALMPHIASPEKATRAESAA